MDVGAHGPRRGTDRANSTARFKPGVLAARELGIHGSTLRRYADEGKIRTFRTPGGHRRYDISEFVAGAKKDVKEETVVKNICYCRVSTQKQKEDLERQVHSMRERFPHHDIVTDIGSGLNFKRRGLQGILERAMRGEVGYLVVAYRDRLCRFAFELVEWIVRSNGGKVVVLDGEVGSLESELADDLMAIVHVFSARSYGHRKYGKKKRRQDAEETGPGGGEDGASPPFHGDVDGPEAVDGVLQGGVQPGARGVPENQE